jgi:uncharacterized protein (TIGR03546 family)
MIRYIAKVFAALNAHGRPGEIAAGAACGLVLALIPGGNLLWFFLFLLFFFLKINTAMMFLVLALGKLLLSFLDPVLHEIGLAVLTLSAFEGIFTWLFNLPVLPLTRFNNTIVMGGLIGGIILWIPFFILGRIAVRAYRKVIRNRIADSKFVKGIKKVPLFSKLIKGYRKAHDLYSVVS